MRSSPFVPIMVAIAEFSPECRLKNRLGTLPPIVAGRTAVPSGPVRSQHGGAGDQGAGAGGPGVGGRDVAAPAPQRVGTRIPGKAVMAQIAAGQALDAGQRVALGIAAAGRAGRQVDRDPENAGVVAGDVAAGAAIELVGPCTTGQDVGAG